MLELCFNADTYVSSSWIVYDVAKFLDEHPGGEEVIVAEAGTCSLLHILSLSLSQNEPPFPVSVGKVLLTRRAPRGASKYIRKPRHLDSFFHTNILSYSPSQAKTRPSRLKTLDILMKPGISSRACSSVLLTVVM